MCAVRGRGRRAARSDGWMDRASADLIETRSAIVKNDCIYWSDAYRYARLCCFDVVERATRVLSQVKSRDDGAFDHARKAIVNAAGVSPAFARPRLSGALISEVARRNCRIVVCFLCSLIAPAYDQHQLRRTFWPWPCR